MSLGAREERKGVERFTFRFPREHHSESGWLALYSGFLFAQGAEVFVFFDLRLHLQELLTGEHDEFLAAVFFDDLWVDAHGGFSGRIPSAGGYDAFSSTRIQDGRTKRAFSLLNIPNVRRQWTPSARQTVGILTFLRSPSMCTSCVAKIVPGCAMA